MRSKKQKRSASTSSSRRGSGEPRAAATPPALVERLRPWLLGIVVALFVARPLFPSEMLPEAVDNLPLVMLALVVLLVWLLACLRGRDWWLRVGPLDGFVLFWIVWHTLAALGPWAHGNGRAALNSLWLWIGYGASYFLVRQLLASRRETRALLVVLLALSVGVAGYGLEQYFYEMPQTRAFYHQNPEAALREQGLDFPPGSPERQLFEQRLAAVEPIGTFALTNSLAGLIVPWLTLGLGLTVAEARSRRRWPVLLAGLGSALVLATCLLLTKSRSGYVAALVGVPLVGWACRRSVGRLALGQLPWKWLTAAAASLVVLVAVAWAVGGLDRQIASEATKSLNYRFQYWQSTLAMIADGPICGRGPGQFRDLYTAYKLPEASEEISDPHNFLLEVWVTAGTPALLALLAVLGGFAWRWLDRAPAEGEGLPELAPTGDASGAIVAGAAAGFVAALPLGLMGSAPPGLAAFWLGLPLAAMVVLLFWPWMREGTLPGRLPGVALVVLLVHLLAAGALEFPGVAGTFWLLLAVGMNLSDRAPTYRISRGVGVVFVLIALALTAAAYGTAYAPVLARQAALRRAQEEPGRAAEHLAAAVAADPWAVAPLLQRAAYAFAQAQHQPTRTTLHEYLTAQEAVFARAPWSSAVRAEAGDRYRALAQTTHDPIWEHRAVEVYQEAVRRYPTQAALRARWALALAAQGDREAARREAQEALRLHELTPHQDKKLPEELLNELRQGPLRTSSGPAGPGG